MLISDWSSDVCSSDLGGYPVLPAMLAARKMGIATVIHEQNSVLGRVNRLLARKVDMIATAYADVKRLPSATLEKTVMVGNPVREEIRALREQPYPALSDERSEEHTSELQSLMRISYAVFCLKKNKYYISNQTTKN